MNREEFLHELKTLQPRISEMSCRVVPSSFEADDPELLAYPVPLDWRWKSCEDMLLAWGSRGVMMRLPLFWQAEVPLYVAAHAAGAPILMNEPENMPVGAAAISGAVIDTVITEASDAFEFTQFLVQRAITLPAHWIIVHRVDVKAFLIPELLRSANVQVMQEVHLMPLVPILYQCGSLSAEKTELFHVHPEYALEFGERGYVSSAKDQPFPISQYEIPFSIDAKGTCSCKEAIVAIRTTAVRG